jgi:hypothetical protein
MRVLQLFIVFAQRTDIAFRQNFLRLKVGYVSAKDSKGLPLGRTLASQAQQILRQDEQKDRIE